MCLCIIIVAALCSSALCETDFCVIERDGRLYPYRIFFPSNYRHAPENEDDAIEKFPLVIACHTAGGDESSYFQWKSNAEHIQTIAQERGYVVACPAGPNGSWHERPDGSVGVVKEGITGIITDVKNEIIRQRHIDTTRIYLMGASSGGFAVYAAVADSPYTYAAAASVCAYFPPEYVGKLKYTPMLLFNAQKDRRIPIEKMREHKDKLAMAGGIVKMVETPGRNGEYRNMEVYRVLFDWFDAHQRSADDMPSSTRWENIIRNYEEIARKQPPEPGGIVFIGSSSIGMWKTLKSDFAPLNVIRRGFGGSQMVDSFIYADRIVIPYRPRAVVVYEGDNDIASGKTPERVFGDFKRFVEKIHAALPETPVYYICIKPSVSRWRLWDKMKKANALIEEYAGEHDLVEYIDVATPMLGQDSKPRTELFIKDGLHLNADGYKLWTAVVKPYLEPKPEQ